jgi:hypothetical protein
VVIEGLQKVRDGQQLRIRPHAAETPSADTPKPRASQS